MISSLIKKILLLMVVGWFSLLIIAGFVTRAILTSYVERSQHIGSVVRLDWLSYQRRFFSARADLQLTAQDPGLQSALRDIFNIESNSTVPSLILHLKISHGPLILSKNVEDQFRPRFGLGLIRIDVDAPAAVRESLKAFIADQPLCRIQTLVTFFENFKTSWKTPSIAYQINNKAAHWIWPGIKGTLRIARQHTAIEKNITVMPMDVVWQSHGKTLQLITSVATHRATYVKGGDDLWYGESHFLLPTCQSRIDNQMQLGLERAEVFYRQQAQLGTFHIQSQGHIQKMMLGPKDSFGPLTWDVRVGHLDMKTLSDVRHVIMALRTKNLSAISPNTSNTTDQLLIAIVKTLLQKGLDVDVRQWDLQTPIGMAQLQGLLVLPVQGNIDNTQSWTDIMLRGDLNMKAQAPTVLLQGLLMAKQWLLPSVDISFMEATGIRALQEWQANGYILQKNNDYVSEVQYHKGVWKMNGKMIETLLMPPSSLSLKALAYIEPLKNTVAALPIPSEFDDE